MLDPARHHNEFPFFNPLMTIAKLHPEPSLGHQEHLIFVFMMMKYKLSFQLVELYKLAVEFSRNVRFPVFRDLGEFFGDVDLFHNAPYIDPSSRIGRGLGMTLFVWQLRSLFRS